MREVDLFIGAFLKQEGLHKDKKEQYDGIVKTMEDMQKELTALRQEEQVSVLNWASYLEFRDDHRQNVFLVFFFDPRRRGLGPGAARFPA